MLHMELFPIILIFLDYDFKIELQNKGYKDQIGIYTSTKNTCSFKAVKYLVVVIGNKGILGTQLKLVDQMSNIKKDAIVTYIMFTKEIT